MSTPAALGGHPPWGAMFETAVVGDIRRQAALMSPSPNVYHWRAHGGPEVDLVPERDGMLFPMEIKAGSHPGPRDAAGLAAFRATDRNRNMAPGLVIAPCEAFGRLTDDDDVLPWETV